MPKKPTQKDWSSSIQTILSVEELHLISLRSRTYPKNHRRSGVSPCPEDPLRITQKNLGDKVLNLWISNLLIVNNYTYSFKTT